MPLTHKVDQFVGRIADAASMSVGILAIVAVAAIAIPGSRSAIARAVHQPESGLKVGDTIDVQRELYQASRTTVFLFGAASCRACLASAQLFASIREEVQRRSDSFVLVSTDDLTSAKTRAYVDRLGGSQVKIWGGVDRRVRATPTVAVVDRSGRVRFVQEGAPSSQEDAMALSRAVLRE